jgi:hypothetical protein
MHHTGTSTGPLSLNQDQQLLREWIVLTAAARRPLVVDWMGLEFDARPDIPRLERALTTIVQRHEVLRTAFTEPSTIDASRRPEILRRRSQLSLKASLFEQRVHAPSAITVSEGELDGLRRDWVAHAVDHETLRRDIANGFRYDSPPLVRATVFRCDGGRYLLSVMMPHLVTDGWGMRVFRQELAALYGGPQSRGDTVDLPPIETQFSDFAVWEREQLATAWAGSAEYWRARSGQFIRDFVGLSEIPYWKPAGPAAVHEALRAAVAIDADVTKQLRALCRTKRITMHMAWLAATAITLRLYSGRERVAVLSYAANRTQARWQPLIGWFSNVFVCGLRVPTTSGEAVLREAREAALGVIEHQMVPMSVTWRALIDGGTIPRDFSLPDTVSLDYTTVPRESNRGEPWERPIWRYVAGTRRDASLNIRVTDAGRDLTLVCAYPAAHFSANDARQILQDIQTVMRMLAHAPEKSLDVYRELLGTRPVQSQVG